MVGIKHFCPYVGLQPYTEDDRQYFFGRERDKRIIATNLYAARLTILYGASGVGKTSVLLAGVVPYLREQPRTAVVVFRNWQEASFLHSLKSECLKAVKGFRQKPLHLDMSLPFDEFLCVAAQKFGGSILILFDQFEEYFLYHPEAETANTFDAEFARAVNREEIDTGFLITLREEGLAKLDRFQAHIRILLNNTLRLEHLNAKDAADAIREPLAVYNQHYPTTEGPVTIQDELINEVIEQVQAGKVRLGQLTGSGQAPFRHRAGQIEAPFLQMVMERLWNQEMRANSRVLRLETLKRLKGAKEIVRTHLGGVMHKLDEDEKEVCSKLFDRLVTPSGSKVACSSGNLTQWAGPLATYVPSVLKSLSDSDSRILRVVASPGEGPPEAAYEIYHDLLSDAILEWRANYLQIKEREKAERKAAEKAAQEQREANNRLMWLMMTVLIAMEAEKKRLVLSSALAAAAINNLEKDPELALLLGFHAASLTYSIDKKVTGEASDALRRALRPSLHEVTLTCHDARDPPRRVFFTPDGAGLATLSHRNKARLWDTASLKPKEITMPQGCHGEDRLAVFSPDCTRLAAICKDGDVHIIRLFETDTGSELISWPIKEVEEITAMRFSPEGEFLVLAAKGADTITFWDVASASEAFILPVRGRRIEGLTFSQEGKRIATASVDPESSSEVFDLSERRALFSPFPGLVNAVAFSPDGKLCATANRDKTATILDTATGQRLISLLGHGEQVRDIAFSPDGTRLATAGADNEARVWDAASGQLLFTLSGHTHWIDGIAFSPVGMRLATASHDGTVKLWNVNAHADAIYSVAFSPDGKLLGTASGDKTVKLWNIESEQAVFARSLLGHTDTVYRLAFSPSGRYLGTASFDKTARIWDVDSGEQVWPPFVHGGHVRDIAFNLEETRLATACEDHNARVWDLTTRRLLFALPHDQEVFAVSFGQGGRLASAGWDGTVKLWDADGREELPAISRSRDENKLISIAFSPDGTSLVSASSLPPARIHDVASRQELQTLPGHSKYVNRVAFSQDGKRLATASGDTTVKIWNFSPDKEAKELLTLSVHNGVVNDVAFSPDGKLIATASSDKTFHLSPMDVGELIDWAKKRVRRPLTTEERQKYLHEGNVHDPL